MSDLYLGMLVLAALSVACLTISLWIGSRISPAVCDTAAIVVVALAALYAQSLWQKVSLAQALPFSNLIVVGNWFPLLASVVAGLAWRRIPGGWFRKAISNVTLCGTAWFAVLYPIFGEVPRCANAWTPDGFCMQTNSQTCSAASAASLLSMQGIPATEQEMAELCLTRDGTTWQGLYRGLKLKTQGTPWDVRVVQGDARQLLREATRPMILSVGLAPDVEVDGAYEREYGWRPGLRHSVILMGSSYRDRVEIVDPHPEIGHEYWTVDDLSLFYRGPALQLVPRERKFEPVRKGF